MSKLTFDELRAANLSRVKHWHSDYLDPTSPSHWNGADWSNAMQGEAGEAGNVVKKLRRVECGLKSNNNGSREELLQKLEKEIGDTIIYMDILAEYYGLNMGDCVVTAFNQVSEREDFPERLFK